MFGLKLPSFSSTPKSAINYLVSEVEKRTGKPCNHLIMNVDFSTEEIIFELPEDKRKESMKNAFMFSIISSALSTQLGDDIEGLEIVALIVIFKREIPLHIEYYYIKDGEKLKSSKTL